MVKRFYIIIWLVGAPSILALCQSSDKIDSLRNLLRQTALSPSHKADLQQALGDAYRKDQMLDSALWFYKEAQHFYSAQKDSIKWLKCNNTIAEAYLFQGNNQLAAEVLLINIPIAAALQDTEILAQTYNSLGRTSNQVGDYETGLKHYEEALHLSIEANLERLSASTYYGMGMNYYGRGDFPKALAHYEQALTLYKKLNNKNAVAITYSAMGNIYYDQGFYTKALQHHIEALATNKELNNQFGVASNYSNIANVYFIQNNFEKAREYQAESLHMHEALGNKTGMATNYYNLALIYDKLHEHQEALTAQYISLTLHEEIQDKAGVIFCHKHLGDLFAATSKFSDAFHSYEKAMALSKEIGDQANLARTLVSIGTLQRKIHQLSPARYNLEQGLTLSSALGIKDVVRDAYYQLMVLDSTRGNYSQALANYKLYTQYKDSLIDESNHRMIREIQTQYETDKKDQAITLLNKESEIQKLAIQKQREVKNMLILGIFLVIVFSLFIYQYYITKQKLKLQLLRNKIATDLHDEIGSTLSSITIFSEVAQQQSKESIPYLQTIGDSSRKMLDAMADIVWTINPENDQFENMILKMRSFAYELLGARKIDFQFLADHEISKRKLPMNIRKNLYLIFKEAVNNMAKYSDAKRAHFSIKEDGGYMTMSIRDDGKGFDTSHPKQGNGIKNMHKRAKEMGAFFTLESNPGAGTQIQLKIAV